MRDVWASLKPRKGGLTRADRQDVDRQKIRAFGRPVGQKVLGARDNHQNMGDAKNGNAPANQLETARPRIGHPAKDHRQGVGKHAEGLRHSIGDHGPHAQRAGSLLVALGRGTPAVPAPGKRAVDVVADQRLHAVVRGALAEFDDADEVRDEG